MNKTIKALVVDDHPLVAQATKNLLQEIDVIDVVGIANNAAQCLEMIKELQPNLVFLDYQLPDESGTEVAKHIRRMYADIHIVIFTGIEINDLYNTFIDIKVSGILSKESSVTTIKNMVNCILDGHTMLPLSIFHNLKLNAGESLPQEHLLTTEEISMMNMVVKGATHDQIADQIHMSKRTVDNYLKKIYDKLGVKSRLEAIERFIKSRYH
jgi:two-component system competent response regulator ComA